MKRLWVVLAVLAGLWIAALIQVGQPLGWDEIEFFRAARWIGEGQVPYRDFWEHHTPLQWFLFAPFARFLGGGAGVEAIVAMRWVQVLLWASSFAILFALARRGDVPRWASLAGATFLLGSTTFVRNAVELRVDVPGHLAYLAALLVVVPGTTRPRAIAFGALMSAAVLANMRLAPLVVLTALLLTFWRSGQRRWGWNRDALWMVAGVLAVAGPFLAWLQLSGALPAFVAGVIRYNVASSHLLEVDTFFVTLLAPLWSRDLAGIAFAALGLTGAILSLRRIRTPGPLEMGTVLLVVSVATIAVMEVHYPYHFQGPLLLMAPLAGLAIARLERWLPLTFTVAAAALLVNLIPVFRPGFGNEMRYQDAVMTDVDRLTRPDEAVWDGCGYALRRRPAYRFWFLPTGVRLLAGSEEVEPYDPSIDPPAAIIYNLRLQRWFEIFPRSGFYAVHHYVPLRRNLWVPGLSAVAPPGRRLVWRMPRGGEYDVWASEMLLRHPWLTRPLEYAATVGPQAARLEIPLSRLPLAPADSLRWRVDGRDLAPGTLRLRLQRGSQVELISSNAVPLGVLVVPRGVTTLGAGPEELFEF